MRCYINSYNVSIRRFVSLLTAFVLVTGLISFAPANAAGAPAFDAELTDDNIISLLDVYDSDAAHILKAQKKKGDSFASWYFGANNLAEAVDTTVHEEFHAYTFYQSSKFNAERFYLGDGKDVEVSETDVFTTYDATKSIPDKYRTFRYDTYVSETSNSSSNVSGVYGLINEFCAYYWGMHASESLYDYIHENSNTINSWRMYYSDYNNNRNAYAEFYYYTLVYLKYAKENKPNIYKDIINNSNYIKVFSTMEKKYRQLMSEYESDLDKISYEYNGSGFKDNCEDGMFKLKNYSFGSDDDYALLMPLINSDEYKEFRVALGVEGNESKSTESTVTTEVPTTTETVGTTEAVSTTENEATTEAVTTTETPTTTEATSTTEAASTTEATDTPKAKQKNPLKVKVTKKTYKRKKLKKATKLNIGLSNIETPITYVFNSKVYGAGFKLSSDGNIIIPKKCKKGTYKITIKASATKEYKATTKKITIVVK